MLIKSADDKSKRLALLESLATSPLLDRDQKKWVEEQVWALRIGVQGERDAAFYIDSHFKDAPNHAVLHDLRFDLDGEVTQIDHLVIARSFMFYLLETKNFNGNLRINEHGEFSVRYSSGKTFGIPSPLEQSRRHERALVKILERLGITGRINREPDFRHVVLIHPQGLIERPDARKFDTSNVIKADQFVSWRKRHVEKDLSTLQVLGAMLNLRSADTVREWSEMLVRQHRPENPLALPDFIRPRVPRVSPRSIGIALGAAAGSPEVCTTCGSAISQAESEFCRAHSLKFDGGLYCRAHQVAFKSTGLRSLKATALSASVPPGTAPAAEQANSEAKKRLICATCNARISFPEGRFCWSQSERFGGLQYCREHQKAFA